MICELCAISLGISVLRIDQNLFGTIEFPMNAVAISTTSWRRNYGLRLLVATSSTTENSLAADKLYTNKLDYLYSATLLYKYQLTPSISLLPGVGYTSYRTTWLVDGVAPWWTNDTDSAISYQLSARYEISSALALELGYVDYYRKNKPDFGRETTRGFSVSFIYKF